MTLLLDTPPLPRPNQLSVRVRVPPIVAAVGDFATKRFVEFFTVQIRNANTRYAYRNAVGRFCDWCDSHGIGLLDIEPVVVAAYVELLIKSHSVPTTKQHLAAIRMLFDYLVTGQVMPFNPAAAVRGPKHIVKKGKTPVITAEEARQILDVIDISTLKGLRDRALIGVLAYSFARISAAVGMDVEDIAVQGRRFWFSLREKGGVPHQVPAHHNAEVYVEEYLDATDISAEPKTPLFRTLDRRGQITQRRLDRTNALRMVQGRAKEAGIKTKVCNHTFRAAGITTFRKNGGSLENAMHIACHASASTTKLYDRSEDEVTLDEIERIVI